VHIKRLVGLVSLFQIVGTILLKWSVWLLDDAHAAQLSITVSDSLNLKQTGLPNLTLIRIAAAGCTFQISMKAVKRI
jgi:hypothetical protein